MKNTTTSTYAFEPRQRSIAPTSMTFQGRSVPVAGVQAGWQQPLLPTSAFGGAARGGFTLGEVSVKAISIDGFAIDERGSKRHTAPTTDPRSRIPVLT
ncbi:hypothetical protein IC607_15200 [Cellulomonas sp. JH27-2]|uniref:hypothetical protein n=1 Tax=Cellulomonas sp. JH27-2 TaxID=2774139 RepID=UPI00177BC672|nr:hypothetical protein [Cellulomonas sp. JH27-2]MBD8060313.1 hypothetical protein [Cellulomonas sp. JH27-2]